MTEKSLISSPLLVNGEGSSSTWNSPTYSQALWVYQRDFSQIWTWISKKKKKQTQFLMISCVICASLWLSNNVTNTADICFDKDMLIIVLKGLQVHLKVHRLYDCFNQSVSWTCVFDKCEEWLCLKETGLVSSHWEFCDWTSPPP